MAARSSSSTSIGLIVTLVIVGLCAVVFFALSVIAFAQLQQAKTDLETRDADVAEFARDLARAEELKRAPSKERNEGVIDFLDRTRNEVFGEVTGSSRGSIEEFRQTVEAVREGSELPLADLIGELRSSLQSVTSDRDRVSRSRDELARQLENTTEQMADLEASHRDTVAELNARIGGYESTVDRLRTDTRETVAESNVRVEDVRTRLESELADRDSQIRGLQDTTAELQERIEVLLGERNNDQLLPNDESTLADGRIIAVDGANDRVFIDRGLGDKIVLGMTFEVYSPLAPIEVDEDGEYAPGKATIEITRIDASSSQARVLRQSRGQPLVDGDLIANAVYDPAKAYRMVVYGNFDTNADGIYTRQEADEIIAIITEWGGEVVEELTGDVDFLVIGRKPPVRPQPRSDAPFAVIEQYIEELQESQLYDELLEQATSRSLPVLNQNRLFTLTGLGLRS
ncbi:MAG: hypothetical protein AAGI30_03995 [Planctomycetota bacterium]